MPTHAPNRLWTSAVAAVRRDPHKAGFLTALVAILAVLQVRLQMSHGDGPNRANASSSAARPDNGATIKRGAAGASRPQDTLAAVRAWREAPPEVLGRNLFAVDLDRYPQDGNRPTAPVAAPATQGFWDELAKSMSFHADARKERQILVENLQQQASQLRLQSTMMGASPKAVIDGEMVGEGDVIASFRVLRIEPRRIIVEREGIKLEIQMK